MEGAKKYNLPLAVAVFLIGFFAGFLFKSYFPEDAITGKFFSGDSQSKADEEGGLLLDVGNFGSANYLSVESQPAGSKVFIKEAGFADGGWIVVREDAEGAPGKILGARRLDAGKYENIEVELLRGTEPGLVYHAILHGDDGDKEFDFNKDFPIRNDSGETIIREFNAF